MNKDIFSIFGYIGSANACIMMVLKYIRNYTFVISSTKPYFKHVDEFNHKSLFNNSNNVF